jgi:hypothetical protein
MNYNVTRASIAASAACVLTAAMLLPGFPPVGTHPGAASGSDPDWVPLTLLYTSDVKGKIDPCG